MNGVVALPLAVLVLRMRQHHPDHRYLGTARGCGEVTMRDAVPITGEDLVESGDSRIVGFHDGDSDGQPPAVHEALMELPDLATVCGTADEQQVGISIRVSLLQAQAVRTQSGTPGDVNTQPGCEQRVPHCFHAQHVAGGGFAIEK